MVISVDWGTRVITVEQSDMTLVTSTPYDIYELDLDVFRLALKALEAGVEGMSFPDTHRHNTLVTIAGVTLARVVEIINGYTITFENGSYAVNLVGANSNVADVLNLNQVSVRASNSAGLIESGTSGLTPAESAQLGTITSVNSNVTALSSDLNTLEANVANLDADVVDLDSDVANLSTVLSNVDSNIVSVNNTVANVNANLTQVSSDVSNLSQIVGLTDIEANMLLALYEIHGLDPTKPLVVTGTARTAGNIAQTIASNTSTTVVTRT